ncbi:MAG: Gfo/Idh/MocA family oxidoreductase [Fimbriimonadaceae bacterium]
MASDLTRRDVLKGAAAAAAGLALAGKASPNTETPKHRNIGSKGIRLGIIGVGGKGWSGMQQAAEFGPVIALCDIDANALGKGLVEYPRAATFGDYRTMLDAMHKQLDAVVISTPDHHHAPAAAMAMKYGLHCYCEKPLTRTIWEARQLAKIARDKKVQTQMGNQSTASTPMRKAAALIKRGDFGPVKEVHVWTDRAGGWWKQGVPRPAPALPPKQVDFDLWLGPRPERPYADGYHPFAWRGWWDFGTGSLGDMGCHIFNMPFMALDLRNPVAVQAETSGHNRDSFPEWVKVHYEFVLNKSYSKLHYGNEYPRKPDQILNLYWYDGGKRPDASLVPGYEVGGNGSIVVCEKGTIFSPDEGNTTFHLIGGGTMPDIEVEESPGHMAEFARAITEGKPARSNMIDYSGPLTETVLLGNLAIWADGPRVEWDVKNMKTKGTNEFDSLIRPAFKPGWSL